MWYANNERWFTMCFSFYRFPRFSVEWETSAQKWDNRGAFDSAKNHKSQRRKRQSVTAKREKSQTPKFV